MFGLFRKKLPWTVRWHRTSRRWSGRSSASLPRPPITVSEVQCGDVACPGNETVVLVMVPGRRTKAYRVPPSPRGGGRGLGREALLRGRSSAC